MKIDQSHLNLVARIYDSVLDPAAWTGILDDLCPLTGARASSIVMGDLIHPALTVHGMSSVVGADGARIYNEQYAKSEAAMVERLMEYPARKFATDDDLTGGKGNYAKIATVKWLEDQYGISRRTTVRLNAGVSWLDSLTFLYASDRGLMTSAEQEIAGLFLPHFAKAIELSRPFELLRKRFQSAVAALDRFHVGVFILSESDTVFVTNAEADRLLEANDGFSLNPHHRLQATDSQDNGVLTEAIRTSRTTSQAAGTSNGQLFLIKRRTGLAPFLVEVTPLRGGKFELGSRIQGSVVVVLDPSNHTVLSTSGMEQLYGLTSAEASVCDLLVKGRDVDTIAEVRNVRPNTVRAQLKSIFAKTGSHRQSDLVRLAYSVNLPIDQNEQTNPKFENA